VSRVAITSSIGKNRASIHGDKSITVFDGKPVGNSSVVTTVCIHVVPHFGDVHTNTSPVR